jgi:hypothetical protein
MSSTPQGITPPAPGLEREEPDLWMEDDIPSDDGERRPAARSESDGKADLREERPHKPERE